MEYIYAALLLHKGGKAIKEESVKAVLTAAGIAVDDARVKALVAALEGVNIEEAISKAAAAPSPSQPHPLPQLLQPRPLPLPQKHRQPRRRKKRKRAVWQGLEPCSAESLFSRENGSAIFMLYTRPRWSQAVHMKWSYHFLFRILASPRKSCGYHQPVHCFLLPFRGFPGLG